MTTSPKRPMNPLTLVLVLSAVFFAVFLVISGALFLSKSSGSGKGMGSSLFGKGSVAVVELSGVIMDAKKTIKRLERFEEDDDVKAVVLRLNSPGGSVAPSQEIYQAVKKFKKPLVVSMGSIAASGAFYVAMGAKKVYANPGTITGSIGVIMEFANLQKLYEWARIQRYVIKTGKFKDAGSEFRAMTDEERALLQGMVDDVLTDFKKAVAEGRHLTMPQVTAVADGRILSGNQAKNAKLVDELGTFQDAIDEAGRLGKIKGKPHVMYPEKKKSQWMDLILDDNGKDDSSEASEAAPATGLFAMLRRLVGATGALPGMPGLNDAAEMAPGIYWLWTGAR